MTDRTITEIPLDAIVEHPDQPRYGARAIDELAASIKAVGQKLPILAVQLTPTQYQVIDGHRRVAARRALGLTTVEGIVTDLGKEGRVDELRTIMASNVAREALTPLEEARGYQTMLDLGIKAEHVAKIAGRKAKYVERIAKIAGTTFSDEHREELAAKPVSLEEYEALARHEGSPERLQELMKAVGTPEFKWRARNADEEAESEAVQARANKKLQAAGVKIVNHLGDASGKQAEVKDLRDAEGNKITAKEHADCPGHAAYINQWAHKNADGITYVCRDWVKHGHTHAYRTSDGGAHDPYKEEQARDRAWRKRIKPTVAPRRAWLKELLTASREDLMQAGAHGFLIDAALHRNLDNGPGDLACDLLGVEVEKGGQATYANRDAVRTALLMHSSPLAALLALALAAGDEAVRLSKPPDAHAWTTEHAVRYLRFIEAAGYMLTDVEVELVEAEQKAKQADAAAEIESDDGDPVDAADTCPHCGELECENTCAAAIAALGIDALDELTDGELLAEFQALHKKAAMQSDETVDQDRLTILASEIESRGYDADDSAWLHKMLRDVTSAAEA